ncbi:MAG: T9SS type A sorting domain-containing protein [Ignavibacteriaceae bacterium]
MRFKKLSKTLLLICIMTIGISAQIKRVEFAASDSVTHCRVIPLSENSLLALYTKPLIQESQSLFIRKSEDNGNTWGEERLIDSLRVDTVNDSLPPFAGIKLNSGKTIIVFRDTDKKIVLRYSTDLFNWSSKTVLPSTSWFEHRYLNSLSLLQSNDNSLLFSCSSRNRGTYICKSSDEGMTWRVTKETSSGADTPFLFNLNSGRTLFVSSSRLYMGKINIAGSSNNGDTWDINYNGIQHDRPVYNPVARCEKDGTINVWFESSSVIAFENQQYLNYDIYRSTSTDTGKTWSVPIQVTHFRGQDRNPYLSFLGDKSIMNFRSDREDPDRRYNSYFGQLNDAADLNAPPYLYGYKTEFPNPDFPNVLINAYAGSDTVLESVKTIFATENKTDSIELFDDGMHSDGEADDFIFGNILYRLEHATNYTIHHSLTDIKKTNAIFSAKSIFPLVGAGEKAYLNINKFSFSLRSKGEIVGTYDGVPVLFSGGFLISGFSNNTLWGSGMMPASLIEDYYPGKVGSSKDDPRNRIYTVKSSDAPFAPSWFSWKTAVELGALFYDGDKDGVYNPRDLNMNSQWDPSEDRPDLIGDMTAFCVYNDGVPANFGRFGSPPQKIEIRQTVFASGSLPEEAFNNSVFVRYSIINKNPGVPVMDEVLFGFWGDPDLGNPSDDLIGSDTLRQSVFIYNRTPDNLFGVTSPALFSKIVQGPVSYVAGETYNDINQNYQYDEGIDIPLDTAYNRLGNYIGYETFPGAKNLPVYATSCFLEQDPILGDPNFLLQARNSLRGLSRISGQPINPCNFNFGIVAGGVNCGDVDKKMIFSGDPVTNYGWICKSPSDQRTLVSTGPYKLEYDKPVDIIVAYVAGRGSDQFNSIDVARGYADVIQSSYEKNFPELYSYKEINDTSLLIIGNYELFQNHPNPFNPYTIIKYTVESKSRVTVRIFDILGREVAIPVDEEKEAGNYQIRFDAGALSSGVYFYQFRAGNFVSTKKMILLR